MNLCQTEGSLLWGNWGEGLAGATPQLPVMCLVCGYMFLYIHCTLDSIWQAQLYTLRFTEYLNSWYSIKLRLIMLISTIFTKAHSTCDDSRHIIYQSSQYLIILTAYVMAHNVVMTVYTSRLDHWHMACIKAWYQSYCINRLHETKAHTVHVHMYMYVDSIHVQWTFRLTTLINY